MLRVSVRVPVLVRVLLFVLASVSVLTTAREFSFAWALPAPPLWVDVAVSIAAFVWAVVFSRRYPEAVRRRVRATALQ